MDEYLQLDPAEIRTQKKGPGAHPANRLLAPSPRSAATKLEKVNY